MHFSRIQWEFIRLWVLESTNPKKNYFRDVNLKEYRIFSDPKWSKEKRWEENNAFKTKVDLPKDAYLNKKIDGLENGDEEGSYENSNEGV